MKQQIKWYNSKWFYLTIIVLFMIGLYFGITKSTTYFNYQELLKTENTSLKVEIDSLKKKYEKLEKKRVKIVMIRERITTKEQDDRIAYLEKELKKIRTLTDTVHKKDTPQELYQYFKDLK
jgi:predicted RND superfamily exporter protein